MSIAAARRTDTDHAYDHGEEECFSNGVKGSLILMAAISIADAGGIMPPKSTWFEPKLRDAMFCHLL